jgi:hypothetical protein
MQMRRVPRYSVADLDALKAVVARCSPATLVVDVEPGIARWSSQAAAFSEGVEALRHTVVRHSPTVDAVILATNSRSPRASIAAGDSPRIEVIPGAGKPWRTRYLANRPRPILVVGDQVVTDGLLAWRLGAPFAHWRASGPAPWWPRVQGVFGRLLAPLLFRDG